MVRTSIELNIELTKMYIVQRISEGISENLRRNPMWPTSDYIKICRVVMTIKSIPLHVQKSIVQDAVRDGYENYFNWKRTGLYTYHNGCEQHPELLIGDHLENLYELLLVQENAALRSTSEEEQRYYS